MERSFSVERWPSGYAFTSKCCTKIYTRFINLLSAARWLPVAYAGFAWERMRNKELWWIGAVFMGVETLRRLYITDERLIMLKGYGIQMEARTFNGRVTLRTIPISEIEHLLINEAIQVNQVIFYMLIRLKHSDELVMPFKNAMPRLEGLQTIYRTFNEMFPTHMRGVTADVK